MDQEKKRVLQIIPAQGISALFFDDQEEPVVCLALIEVQYNSRTHYRVGPMIYVEDLDICFAEDFPNYKGMKFTGP